MDLTFDFSAPMNLIWDPKYIDAQLVSLMSAVVGAVTPVAGADWNNDANDGLEGAGAVMYTKVC
jgi:hypothetical protein